MEAARGQDNYYQLSMGYGVFCTVLRAVLQIVLAKPTEHTTVRSVLS